MSSTINKLHDTVRDFRYGCGNPCCGWKRPVHGCIPNWLRPAGAGRILEAADPCHETNSPPEGCGRIRPQDRLCEQSCSLATGFGAVTIGAIQRCIVDKALLQRWGPELSRVRAALQRACGRRGPAGPGLCGLPAARRAASSIFRFPEMQQAGSAPS